MRNPSSLADLGDFRQPDSISKNRENQRRLRQRTPHAAADPSPAQFPPRPEFLHIGDRHLIWRANLRPSMDRPFDYISTNVTGTLRLLEHCRIHGIPHFVFASSSSVYGPDTPLPAEESATPDPCSPYAVTKLQAEQWGRLYSRIHGLRFLALRLFSVWGPGQRPDLALEAFRRRIIDGKPVIIHGDGSQRRDLTHVEDVARAVELALHWPGPGSAVLNIGTGKNHSVMDMLDAAARVPAPRVEHLPPHPADVPQTLAAIQAAGTQLGWHPGFPSRTGRFPEPRRLRISRHENRLRFTLFGGLLYTLYTSGNP